MNQVLLDAYHWLPPGARSLAASTYGFTLRWRRYGPGFERRVAVLRERERWTREQWHQHQEEQLRAMLAHAMARVPHYRELARRSGQSLDPARLESWPVLEKAVVRANPLHLVSDDCRPSSLVRDHTSGTTGTPLLLLRSAGTEQMWYAMFEVRARNAWGVSWRDRWAIFGGRLIVPAAQRTPPFWTVNRGMNQLYLSSYHLSPATAESYLQALADFAPAYLWAYTSALYTVAQFILESGRRDIRPKVLITSAEPLYAHQRETIEQAFQCPLVETYGMSEMVATAIECRHGRLHDWPDLGLMELLDDDDAPVPPGQPGQVVCTTLINREQPFIRYRTGDVAVAMPADFACPCGSLMPALERIEGRSDDVIVTRDGRLVGRLDPVFKSGLNIREAQIIQEDWSAFTVRYVADDGCGEEDLRHVSRELTARVGECQIHFERVPHIERTKNGKFRAVISRMNAPGPR